MDYEKIRVKKMAADREKPDQQHADRLEVECPIGKQKAAKILGVSTDTLDQWTAKYGIPHYKYAMEGNSGNRGKVVYLASELVAFRERFRVESSDSNRDPDHMEERDIGKAVDEMIRSGT